MEGHGCSNSFWAHFLAMSTTEPDLLCQVCKFLSIDSHRALRGVNRATRLAINATVTHVRCTPATAPTYQQLHVAFPNLSSLHVQLPGSGLCAEGTGAWLRRLAGCTQLPRLRQLSLTVPPELTPAAGAECIWDILHRCEHLQLGCRDEISCVLYLRAALRVCARQSWTAPRLCQGAPVCFSGAPTDRQLLRPPPG
jgi:hypothetical protein